MTAEEALTYPPCCDRQDLVPIGGNIAQCQTCGEVLSPYARVQHKIEELEGRPALTEEQRLRMIGNLDQLAADMERWREVRPLMDR